MRKPRKKEIKPRKRVYKLNPNAKHRRKRLCRTCMKLKTLEHMDKSNPETRCIRCAVNWELYFAYPKWKEVYEDD